MPKLRLFFPVLFAGLLALQGCSVNPFTWWKSVNHKAEELATLEARHEILSRKYESLKREHYRLEQLHAELKAEIMSRDLAQLKLEETGSPSGRNLASIDYKVPHGLSPGEILALAYEHFREERFAEAAATFEYFQHLPEATALQDASAMYTAGVAWYQLGNFKKSREQLEAARGIASGEQKGKIHRKVDLWMRVIDRKIASESHGG